MDINLRFFLDSGLVRHFIPLSSDPITDGLIAGGGPNIPDSLTAQHGQIGEFINAEVLSNDVSQEVYNYCVRQDAFTDKRKDSGYINSYIRYRVGMRFWTVRGSPIQYKLYGLWIEIETNTAASDMNVNLNANTPCNRGVIISKHSLSQDERAKAIDLYNQGKPYANAFNHSTYVDMKNGNVSQPIDISNLGFGDFQLILVAVAPAADPQTVDLMLDLGNTRTVGLLFHHAPNQAINPNDVSAQLGILALNSDPSSGDVQNVDNVDAGITSSWMLFHAQKGQRFRPIGGAALETEDRCCAFVENLNIVERPRFLRSPVAVVDPDCDPQKNIVLPQMFNNLVPVMIGEEALRKFNLQSTKQLCENGAVLQQSSPKRYYWDDDQTSFDWAMMLNEDDPENQRFFQHMASIPTFQGEALRHLDDKGDYHDVEATGIMPAINPQNPRYPRATTLTWLMLHILERANDQINAVYSQQGIHAFTPMRLGRVLITHPAGWTEEEVDVYRRRCETAIRIFNDRNVYGGSNGGLAVKLIDEACSPDEAVAGQLPFIFSEINRFTSIPASSWFRFVGKERGNVLSPVFDQFGNATAQTNHTAKPSLRVMNFDIGGGTTDISVVEYADCLLPNEAPANKKISTLLLFKDGRAIAGDNILKRVIEECVIKEFIGRVSGATPALSQSLQALFRGNSANVGQQVVMGRITRNCLIPLGNYCLKNADVHNLPFSAEDAGINQNVWDEFVEIIRSAAANNGIDIPVDQFRINVPFFTVKSNSVNEIVRDEFGQLLQYCAMYIAHYDVDLVIFSGKISELSAVKTYAEEIIPLENERMIFARSFKPGNWYPFRDSEGNIADAKTVTAVGASLYYALHENLIQHWKVFPLRSSNEDAINEWGDYNSMIGPHKYAFMACNTNETQVLLQNGDIIARRRNVCSEPECVYKFVCNGSTNVGPQYNVTLSRDGERLRITGILGVEADRLGEFSLKLWPCSNPEGRKFWQETGSFEI